MVALFKGTGSQELLELSTNNLDSADLNTSGFVTDKGISLGSTDAQVRAAYPHAARTTYLGFPTYLVDGPFGTALAITLQGTVARMAVGTKKSVTSSAACPV